MRSEEAIRRELTVVRKRIADLMDGGKGWKAVALTLLAAPDMARAAALEWVLSNEPTQGLTAKVKQ